jgi:quercetin dioxygenase-like cupin family protein
MKRTMLGLAAAAAVAALAVAVPSSGDTPPIFAQALAVGQMKATTIHTGTGSAVLDRITVKPGGSFGWHTHGAAVAVVVTAGKLTVFDPSVGNCKPFVVSKGMSFVEPANHVHLARNDGTSTVTLYALYLGLPSASVANVPASQPAGCDA